MSPTAMIPARQALRIWEMQLVFILIIGRCPACALYSFAVSGVFLVGTGSTGRSQSEKGIVIAQVIECETGAEHRPGGEEQNVWAFERMQILPEGRKC